MNKIKRFVTGVIVGAVCVASLAFCACVAHNYTMNGYVDKITEESIFVVDTTGNIWEYLFDTGIRKDTFKEHEQVTIHFNDNCSDSNRQDDIITGIEKK